MKLFPFFLFMAMLFSSSAKHVCSAATKAEALALAQKILSDPMIPVTFRDAKISDKMHHKPTKDEGWETYDLLIHGKPRFITKIALFKRTPEVYDFSLHFDNTNDPPEGDPVADWDKLVPQWDAFVKHYWPELHRISDWNNEIRRYSSDGTFSIQYALTDQKLEMFRVDLSIRLSDGKIGGVGTQDVRYLLKDKMISPPPTTEQLISAVKTALAKNKNNIIGTSLVDAPMAIRDVRRFAFPFRKNGTQILDSGNMRARDAKDDAYIITFTYAESQQVAEASHIAPQKELEGFRQEKPLTHVSDQSPSWSADGKQLFFVTTRDAKDRSWWNRGTVAFLQALAVNQVGTDNIQFISPFKTINGDYGLYDLPRVSPDGRYLAAEFRNEKGYLFMLDLQKGILHIPERDPAFLVRQQKKLSLPDEFLRMTQSMFRSDGNRYPWISKGFQWLSNGDLLFVGGLGEGARQIYLGRKTSADPGQSWDVWPVYRSKGEDVELCLSSNEKVLSWAHQDAPSPPKLETTAPQQWHFVTADFDATKPGVSNLIQTDLPEEPVSISWDSKNKRWLIVTKQNNLLWIRKKDDKLTTIKVLLPLTWNENKLRSTSAAISPDGSRIALAAELEKPVAYSKTECVIHSMIFNWDGKGTFAKPFFDPTINGIPRYIFPATGSQWAKVEGNLKKFGLQEEADSDYVVSSEASRN